MKRITPVLICLVFLVCYLSLAFPVEAGSSSPFYDLRNQSNDNQATNTETEGSQARTEPDSPEASPETDAGQQPAESPETVGKEARENGGNKEAPDSAGKTDGGADVSEPADEGPDTAETEQSPPEQSSSDTREEPATVTSGEEPATILPLKDPPVEELVDTKLKSSQQPDTLVETPRSGLDIKPGDTHPVADSALFHSPWYGNYYLMGGAIVLGGLGVIGLLYIGRRRKVRIIKTANRTANKYLNMNRSNSTPSSRSASRDSSGTGTAESPSTGSTPHETPPPSEPATEPTWDRTPEELKQLGIDPEYRSIFKMHFQDGLSPEQIAAKTDFGEGEVGLALDLVDRLESSNA